MELLLHQWGDWPELYRNTDKTEATEIVIIDSQMNYRGKLDTYGSACGPFSHLTEKYIIRYTTIDVPGDSCRTPDRKGFSYESD